jgi:hypothetical protein
MSSGTLSRFNQFRLFSYLFSGGAFLILLSPLLPSVLFNQNSLILLATGILVGYLVGVCLFQVSSYLQSRCNSSFKFLSDLCTSHRQFLSNQIDNPSQINEHLIHRFKQEEQFEEQESCKKCDSDVSGRINEIFPRVLSYIQLNGQSFSIRMRSRYSLSRSMLLVMLLHIVIYTFFLLISMAVDTSNTVYAEWFNRFWRLYLVAIIFFILLSVVWYIGYRRTRKRYIEYVISDYVNLKERDDLDLDRRDITGDDSKRRYR